MVTVNTTKMLTNFNKVFFLIIKFIFICDLFIYLFLTVSMKLNVYIEEN